MNKKEDERKEDAMNKKEAERKEAEDDNEGG
jgi:hypothetical protein